MKVSGVTLSESGKWVRLIPAAWPGTLPARDGGETILDSDDARALARAILECADEAERNAGGTTRNADAPVLSVTHDGASAHLYRMTCGSYESRRTYICAHRANLSQEQAARMLEAALATLPEEIADYDYMADPEPPDLFELALESAGFVSVDALIKPGPCVRLMPPVLERAGLERELLERADEAERNDRAAFEAQPRPTDVLPPREYARPRRVIPCATCGKPKWIETDPIARPGHQSRTTGAGRCRCRI